MKRILLIPLLLLAAVSRADEPASNLDAWLDAPTPDSQSASGVSEPDRTGPALAPRDNAQRPNALPGVVELSDGRVLAGKLLTTADQPWALWVEDQKRWRLIPPAAVLEISAEVVEERLELQWRWKAMGEPEKVYTGKSYPFRRFEYTFLLADGSKLRGVIKGQPLRLETGSETLGPWLLQERSKGKLGESLKDHLYLKRVIISRRAMEQVQSAHASN